MTAQEPTCLDASAARFSALSSSTLPSLALQRLRDCHTSKQRGGKGKPRQLPAQIQRQVYGHNRLCDKSIETGDMDAVGGQNEHGGKFALLILACLPLKISVQLRNSAVKSSPIMTGSEELNPVFDQPIFRGTTHLRVPCSASPLPSCARWAWPD